MPRDEALRAELLAMASRPAAPGNADRLWSILDDFDVWPGRHLVGADGVDAAWLVAQLGDTDLQRRCLEYLECAVDCGDADPAHYACLVDRIRMADGRPQVYGSQFVVAGTGEVTPWPIVDPLTVDERRREVGLPTLDAERRRMQEQYHEHGSPLWPVTSPAVPT